MNGIERRAPMELLLVEDDPGDVAMTREALAESKMLVNLSVVTNGEEALSYLRGSAPSKTPAGQTSSCSTSISHVSAAGRSWRSPRRIPTCCGSQS